jgi:hypothetical protein
VISTSVPETLNPFMSCFRALYYTAFSRSSPTPTLPGGGHHVLQICLHATTLVFVSFCFVLCENDEPDVMDITIVFACFFPSLSFSQGSV